MYFIFIFPLQASSSVGGQVKRGKGRYKQRLSAALTALETPGVEEGEESDEDLPIITGVSGLLVFISLINLF